MIEQSDEWASDWKDDLDGRLNSAGNQTSRSIDLVVEVDWRLATGDWRLATGD